MLDKFNLSQCRDCAAEIVWAVTADGKLLAVDADESPTGNVELIFGRGAATAIVHNQIPMMSPPLHERHMATCPMRLLP